MADVHIATTSVSAVLDQSHGSLFDFVSNTFSSIGLKVNNMDFSKWKLSDLKDFLKKTNSYSGLSTSKKEILVSKAELVWKNVCDNRYVNLNDKSGSNDGTPDFEKWTISKLHDFLADRGVNKTGNKSTLVKNALGAYKMCLPIVSSSIQEEIEEVKRDETEKLSLPSGIQLPNPRSLTRGWVMAPTNLPDTLFDQVTSYLDNLKAGKAYKGGQSLLESGHLSNTETHFISPDIRYCFVKSNCLPEQKLSKQPYVLWVLIHKDTGNIVNGDCLCPAGASGVCKHIGALLWYIEREVRLGNNRTCTSKTQQWSVPSIKQQKLHQPDRLANIEIRKPIPNKMLKINKRIEKQQFSSKQPYSILTESDIDELADITNGNCGLVALMRKKNSVDVDINNIASEVDVETSPSIDFPKTVDEVCKEIGHGSIDEIIHNLKISNEQQKLVISMTQNQSTNEDWYKYRRDRITASKFKAAVSKVDKFGTIKINCKSLIKNVCGYYPKYSSKALDWGISNEPVARKNYIILQKKKHKKLVVIESGFWIDLDNPFIGASPDGLVNCLCHGNGLLEIKCPWTHRGLTISEFVREKNVCLKEENGTYKLKRDHEYFYQVQLQMHVTQRNWCDFYLCTSIDNMIERIYYDKDFMYENIHRAKLVYEKVILPEIFNRTIRDSDMMDHVTLNVNNCVKELIEKVCEIEDIYVDFFVH